jgi:hypothetical protein
MLPDAFWSNFWPGMASTIVGVVVGVPIALWLAHYGALIQERARQAEDRSRLHRGLQSLSTAMRHNTDRLRHLSEVLQKDQVPLDVGLDVSAWEVSKQEIIPFLHDADMQRRIAYHFTRTEALRQLAALLLDQYVGVTSALVNAPQNRQALRNHMQRETDNLYREAEELANDISKVSTR